MRPTEWRGWPLSWLPVVYPYQWDAYLRGDPVKFEHFEQYLDFIWPPDFAFTENTFDDDWQSDWARIVMFGQGLAGILLADAPYTQPHPIFG